MSEARKIDHSKLPEIPVDAARPRSREPVLIQDADDASRLPPLPQQNGPVYGEAELVSSAPRKAARAPQSKRKAKGSLGRMLLILFLIGLCSFAGSASLTAGIVLGNFDMKSGKFKQVIQNVKVLVQQLRN